MKRYAKYKDSGISWIGQVPDHWETKRAKYMFTKEKRGVRESDEVVTCFRDGEVTLRKNRRTTGFTESLTEIGYQGIRKNDLVIHQMDAFAGAIGVSDSDGKGTSVYHCCTPKGAYDVFYYAFLIRTMAKSGYIQSLYRGIRERSSDFNFQVFGKQYLLVPPPEEQKAIAEFLDNKTKQINELVSAKQKQIELLKEYKQAVIAKAVTQGVNPKTKMKDSGISWIGQIPEHWECSTLRKHLQFVSEKGHPEEQLLSVTREYGVIVRNTESKEENHNVIPEDLSNYKLVEKGQFAINKMKAWQGSYAVSSYTGIVSPAYYVCELNFDVKEFFSIAIRSKTYVPFFTMYSKGIRVDQWDLSPIGLKTIPFFIPPKDEQKRIVAFVNDKIVKVDSQILSIEKQIANLNEYKQSLISDVVTGKVKVA